MAGEWYMPYLAAAWVSPDSWEIYPALNPSPAIQALIFLKIIFRFIYLMYECFRRVCIMYVHGAFEGQKSTLDPLEPEFLMIVSHHVVLGLDLEEHML